MPSLTDWIICAAMSGVFIIAAPAPCFSIERSGQPILISIPSKPSEATNFDASRIFSGCAEKSCATIGRSASVYSKSLCNTSRPLLASPSAETNSVHVTSGLPYFAITRRKAGSVTSAIGASAKKGFGNFSQKLLVIEFI